MSITINKNKRALILVMIALSFIVISFSYFYYKDVNSSKDPRITDARELYKKYNAYAAQNDFVNVFALLDSVESIYKSVNHFAESFEVGVLYNNRAAAYLTMAIYDNAPEEYMLLSKDSLIQLGQISVQKSILIYENWLKEYSDKTSDQINIILDKDYLKALEQYSEKNKNRFLKNRVKEIETAQYETKRRLSVAYTNLGIIYRHKEQYEQTIESYQKAIELWDQNLTAENNLNILLGKDLKKRNLIQKLFPPKRKEN
ncbi:MAG: tetratricopeptide repeat protein [Bacteroidales bacterium]|jgi:tetratricopeptide (TPR) repeat protein|nr:tetratricopeptide repeat protein [Bacteroidales bacterium]